MANSAVVTRTHLVYGVCLPLAVLIGYLLAEPFELGSISVVCLVLSVLSLPLLMRWHHPLLIFSCNAAIYPYFIPGHLALWMVVTLISFSFVMLNRALGRDVRLFQARQVSQSLLFIGIVVIATAYLTGGIGFGSLGGGMAGGKRYLTLFLAIMLYFGLSSIHIPRKWAGLAIAIYFLSSLTGLMGYIVAWAGPPLYFLVEFFPIQNALSELNTPGIESGGTQIARYGEFMGIAFGIFSFLFARYGVRGIFDLGRPWRLALLAISSVALMYAGFRSAILSIMVLFAVLFYMEGLLKTKLCLVLVFTTVLGMAVSLPFAQKMPLQVQRSLAFLPLNLDPMVRHSADDSTNWRLEMWKEVLPTVPKYLIKGKGFAIDSADMALVNEAQQFGTANSYEGSMIAGDYHSGPLSLIIPFGLFGVAGFVWFLYASVKVLRQNYLFGDASLKRINTFLLALFLVRIFVYFFVFGSFYSDLFSFTSLIALSLSLNGGVCQPLDPELEPVIE